MGLTVHATLRAPANLADAAAPALVRRLHTVARRWHRTGRVDAVGPVGRAPADLVWLYEWIVVPLPDGGRRGLSVPPVAGHVFPVTLGAGAEPLFLGLCRYPARISDPATGRTRAVRRSGWRLRLSCKTHYAGLHGWEHFRRCHTAAVDLLAALRPLGLRVDLHDEGGYWPGRRTDLLHANLAHLDGLVAALAGALKDASDGTSAPVVQAPIFAHPQFERLEAAGAAALGPSLQDLIRRLTDESA